MESRISRFTIGIGESSWGLNLSLFVFGGSHRVLLSVLYGSSSAKLAKTTLSLCKDFGCALLEFTCALQTCLVWCVALGLIVYCNIYGSWSGLVSVHHWTPQFQILLSRLLENLDQWREQRRTLDLVFYPTNICNVATLASRSMDWWVLRT
jgi:hypothetical protein